MTMDKLYPELSRYPELFSFLRSFIGYFEGEEFTGFTENEVARLYISVFNHKEQRKVIDQGIELLNANSFCMDEFVRALNRHFDKEESAKKWLRAILTIVENVKPLYGRYFVDAIPLKAKKNLKQKYPRLFSFFSTEFKKSNYEDLSDVDIAKRYVVINSHRLINGLIEEGYAFLSDADIPWEEINNVATETFVDNKDFRTWVAEMIGVIKEAVKGTS